MIVVRIIGGLGNQLFQYSFARALSIKFNKRLIIDTSLFNYYQSKEEQSELYKTSTRDYQLKYFNISSKLLNKYFQHIILQYTKENSGNSLINYAIENFLNFQVITPEKFSLSKINQTKNIILDGYWQNQGIIEDYKNELMREIKRKEALPSKYSEIIKEIISTNAVAVHIRRGDYIDNPIMKQKFVECKKDYYQSSMYLINNRIEDPNYFVFSDAIDWAKKNLSVADNVNFVEIDGIAYEHLSLMSQCKHQIIANSTFSWWAAWLNPNSSKLVLYPKNWYYDKALNDSVVRIPSDWIEIENKI